MHRFLRELITEWRTLELPVKDGAIVVAVSGGADSVSLLLALAELREKKKLDLSLNVAHFDHGLRERESDRDEKFVRKLSAQLGFEYQTAKWKRNKSDGKKADNLEQAARAARYEFLKTVANNAGAFAVLTGHTMNDQAETFLMRLVRGTGIDGLTAMQSVRSLDTDKNVMLARPMLNWASREDTEAFCRWKEVKFRNDAMNADQAFLRVKIRKKLIPLLREMNPQIVSNLSATAGLIGEDVEELEITAREFLIYSNIANKDTIEVKVLMELSPAKRKRVLRVWLHELRGDLRRLDREHFTAIERLILNGTGGKTAELPRGERVTLSKGKLVFRQMKVEKRLTGN